MYSDKLRTTGFLAEDTVPSSETLAWERAAQSIRGEILDRVTPQTFYTRACAPEYESDCDTQSVIDAPLKTIARLPLDLLVDPPTKDAEVKSPSCEGFLMVSSKGNKLKKMYCILQNKTIFFLKTSPASKQDTLKTQESILLDNALQVRPLSGDMANWTIELVMIDDVCLVQAKDEAEYMKWVEALCHCARYASVNLLYRQILQLYEDDMPAANVVGLAILASYTVQETVDHIFECFKNKLESLPHRAYDPRDYRLKVTGLHDFMIQPDNSLLRYKYVRECQVSKQTLHLTLVHKSDIEPKVDSTSQQLYPVSMSSSWASTVGTSYSQSQWSSNTKTNLSVTSGSLDRSITGQCLPSSHCDRPLQVRLKKIMNIPKWVSESEKTRPVQFQQCVAVTELVYAGRVVESFGKSDVVPFNAHGADNLMVAWETPTVFESRLPVSNIPREARIVCRVYTVNEDGRTAQSTCILTASRNAFDIDGRLATGDIAVQCYNNMHEKIFGHESTTAKAEVTPLIEIAVSVDSIQQGNHLECIVFNWDHSPDMTQSAIIEDYSPRSSALDRAGWVYLKAHKLEERRVWLILDPKGRTVMWKDSPTSASSQVMQLENALIKATEDNQNRLFIQTFINPIEISILTNTLEECDDWMQALVIVSTDPVYWTDIPLDSLRDTIVTNLLRPFTPLENEILWRNRSAFLDCFEALPRLLSCVNWVDPREVRIVVDMLSKWTPAKQPERYLVLLSKEFANQAVRDFAIEQLSSLSSLSFSLYMPQMIQALKHETYHLSSLAKQLLRCALEYPQQIGFEFFWRLHVESFNNQYRERYTLVLNAFIDSCPPGIRETLQLQHTLFSQGGELDRICQQIKSFHKGGMQDEALTDALRERLVTLNAKLPPIPIPLPIDSRLVMSRFTIHKCKLTSDQNLWLEVDSFDDGDKLRDPVVIIFKSGVNCSGDMFVLQTIRWMNEIWMKEDLDLSMNPLQCITTGPTTNLIRVDERSVSMHMIKSSQRSILTHLVSGNDSYLLDWITDKNIGPDIKRASDLFVRSCAGYCAVAYILGLGNQHYDSILVSLKGQFRFSDFGTFFHCPKAQGWFQALQESQLKPFVFTQAMVKVFDTFSMTNLFKSLLIKALNVVQEQVHLLISMCLLMSHAGIPQLEETKNVYHVAIVLSSSMTHEDANLFFEELISHSLSGKFLPEMTKQAFDPPRMKYQDLNNIELKRRRWSLDKINLPALHDESATFANEELNFSEELEFRMANPGEGPGSPSDDIQKLHPAEFQGLIQHSAQISTIAQQIERMEAKLNESKTISESMGHPQDSNLSSAQDSSSNDSQTRSSSMETMLMDLLSRTTVPQQQLAAQQSVMFESLHQHSAQIEKLSSSISHMEHKLTSSSSYSRIDEGKRPISIIKRRESAPLETKRNYIEKYIASSDSRELQAIEASKKPAKFPSFDELNPFSNFDVKPQGGDESDNWRPVPGLIHSKESLALRRAAASILKQVHGETNMEALYMRANTPEYLLANDVSVPDTSKFTFGSNVLKCVARLPMSLLTTHSEAEANVVGIDRSWTLSGVLKKRKTTKKGFKKRFFHLEGQKLSYYKKEPFRNGIMLDDNEKAALLSGVIDLKDFSTVKPIDDSSVQWGFELVTVARTWTFAAESEQDYYTWIRAICHSVPYQTVHTVYRRMLQLSEHSAGHANEVRLVILASYTVKETVEHIFECYQNMLNAVPLHPYNPEEYVLKVTGFRDYMISPKLEMANYQQVRECMVTKKTLFLTLVHRTKIEAPDKLRNTSQDLLYSENFPLTTSKESRSNITSPSEKWAGAQESNQEFTQTIGKSFQFHDPLRFCVNRVLNIPRYTSHLKQDDHDMTIEGRPLSFTNGVVVVELYDGGKLLEAPIETPDVRMKVQIDNELMSVWTEPLWFRTKTRLNEIPRSARLVFTLFGVKKSQGISSSTRSDGSDYERILTTGINVFDVDGLVPQGEQYIQMMNNLHYCHHGSVPHIVETHKPLIHVTLSTYHTQIAFDWSSGNGWEEKQDTQRSLRIVKSGWLRKTGKTFMVSNWQKRWFHLNQETNSLSYSDGANMPAKRTINIVGATIVAANELNSTFTSFMTSKNIKKELQTWVFKLKPADSNREFILSANSNKEREEWMTAIKMVAHGETFSDDEDEKLDQSNMSIEKSASNLRSSNLSSDTLSKSSGQLTRRTSSTSSNSVEGINREIENLRATISRNPLYELNSYEKNIMWKSRYHFMNDFYALPKLLACVIWRDSKEVDEVVTMLPKWSAASHPAAYIRLLDIEFANENVRSYAVQKFGEMDDITFTNYLPQLVQAIKYENYHKSPLAELLIKRAIQNPHPIGFNLFWAVKAEANNEQHKDRYGHLLNAFVDACSPLMRSILKLQDRLFSENGEFDNISRIVKEMHRRGKGRDELNTFLHDRLSKLNDSLNSTYQLPIDSRIEVKRILVEKCKVMCSSRLPLWVEFENAEEADSPVTIIFKAGDDVQQDRLMLQMIRLMDELWREQGKDLAMEPYKCIPTGLNVGVVQVVRDSASLTAIHKRGAGFLSAIDDTSIANWISVNNSDSRSYKGAVDLFLRSCAGYCVATYVLGISDRHSDNIMNQFGLIREPPPFVFTSEMRYVFKSIPPLGERDYYPQFQKLCGEAFYIISQHVHLFASLLQMMIPAGMPLLRHKNDINHMINAIGQHGSEEEAVKLFVNLTNQCSEKTFKAMDNPIHLIKYRDSPQYPVATSVESPHDVSHGLKAYNNLWMGGKSNAKPASARKPPISDKSSTEEIDSTKTPHDAETHQATDLLPPVADSDLILKKVSTINPAPTIDQAIDYFGPDPPIISDELTKKQRNTLTHFDQEISSLGIREPNTSDRLPNTSEHPPLGVTLDFVLKLIASNPRLGTMSTWDVVHNYVLQVTETTRLSLVDHLRTTNDRKFVKPAQWFVSHAWKYTFGETINALENFFQEQVGEAAAPSIAFWFCAFNNNQHKKDELTVSYFLDQFSSNLKAIGRVVMVMSPWKSPITLQRLWCVFELFIARQHGCHFEVAMCKKEKQHFLDEIRLDVSSLMQMMGSINSEKSKTKEPNDRKEIIKAMGGENAFRVLDRMAITNLQAWLQRTVHQNIAKWHETQGFLLLDGGSIEESSKAFNTARDMYASVAHPTLPCRNLWRVEAAGGFVKMKLGDPLHAWEEKLLSRYSNQESLLGVDHFDTILTGFYIGSMYNTVGEAKKAREWLQRCNTLAQEHPDLQNHPRRLRIMLELANATHRCGAYHDANKLIETTTTLRRELLVEDHPSFSETCICFATYQFEFGDYRLAESTLLPALRNLERTLHRRHPSLLDAQLLMGSIYQREGRIEDCRRIFDSTQNLPHTRNQFIQRLLCWVDVSWGKVSIFKEQLSRAYGLAQQVSKGTHHRLSDIVWRQFLVGLSTHGYKSSTDVCDLEILLEESNFQGTFHCHGCHKDMHGSKLTCNACPPFSGQYCETCEPKATLQCGHQGSTQQLLSPLHFLDNYRNEKEIEGKTKNLGKVISEEMVAVDLRKEDKNGPTSNVVVKRGDLSTSRTLLSKLSAVPSSLSNEPRLDESLHLWTKTLETMTAETKRQALTLQISKLQSLLEAVDEMSTQATAA